ncbi:MAG: hypothetical protein NC453_10900 [Muribaculum sp.]|nr:hypothetical protein [Muribaculum sp.]
MDILKIASRHGWQVSITTERDGSMLFNFHRKAISGVPFLFSAIAIDGKLPSLVAEIVSFVDALDPEAFADEWLKASRVQSSSRYLQAVTDIEDIRTQAWLLAFDLSECGSDGDVSPDHFIWN